MAKDMLLGSICLSDIPREMIKDVLLKDGSRKKYLNIAIIPRKKEQTFESNGRKKTLTHFISCAPKREERVDGVNYFIGDLETYNREPQAPSNYVDPSQVAAADPFSSNDDNKEDDLPF